MPRPALSRADLLRLLAQHDVATVNRMAAFCQLERKAPALVMELAPDETAELQTVPDQTHRPTIAAPRAPKLRARLFQVWSKPLPPPDEPTPTLAPLTLAELQAPADAQKPAKTPLLRQAQYWPALRESLQTRLAVDIDWPALVRQLALDLKLEPVPRRPEALWAAPLWLIWDASERLMPFESDFVALFRTLKRLRGTTELSLLTLQSDHSATLWRGERGRRLRKLPRPTPGTRICLLSDLGALAATTALEQHWFALIRQWRSQGASVVAWLPSAPGQVHAGLAQLASVHHLSPLGRQRPARRGWRTAEQRAEQHQRLQAQAQRMLTLASCALHVAPELLRELRLLDPTLHHAPGSEALVWCAPEVGRSLQSRPLQAHYAPHLRAAFALLPVPLQQAVFQCIERLHATRGRSTLWLEQVLWQCHSAAAAHSEQTGAAVTQARSALQRLFHAGAGPELQHNLAAVAFDVQRVQQYDAKWWASEADWASKLVALADVNSIPPGLPGPLALQGQVRGTFRPCFLAQVGSALWLMPSDQKPFSCQRLTADFYTDLVLVEPLEADKAAPLKRFTTETVPCRLAPLEAMRIFTRIVSTSLSLPLVQTSDLQLELVEVDRPTWAQKFGRDRSGVYALTPEFAGEEAKFYVLPPEQASPASPFLPANEDERWIEFVRGKVLCRLGLDLAFGVFAELQIGKAVQRFRWILPGEFWMGSLEAEPERRSDEGPRHRVRISRGFWLADTACTQALWQAVMDKNPSYFEGDDQRPVDRVSWLDARALFKQIEDMGLPGADVPTEAEWEYACRAGTETPFHFGAQIDPSKANYHGASPYAGGAKGENRECTVTVKALPANDWGLYQMHGNVWEWCKDGLRSYAKHAEAETDPVGPQSIDTRRALRGGSWSYSARSLRAASRFASSPGPRGNNLGLRLVLRSTRSAAEPLGDVPQGQALGATGLGVRRVLSAPHP